MASLLEPTLDDEPSLGAGMKINGKVPRVLVGVSVVTLLGGWKSLEPEGLPPVNETVYKCKRMCPCIVYVFVVYVCVHACALCISAMHYHITYTQQTLHKPLEFNFCKRLSTDLNSSLIFLSAPYKNCNTCLSNTIFLSQ